jgi:hypothetical protein
MSGPMRRAPWRTVLMRSFLKNAPDGGMTAQRWFMILLQAADRIRDFSNGTSDACVMG